MDTLDPRLVQARARASTSVGHASVSSEQARVANWRATATSVRRGEYERGGWTGCTDARSSSTARVQSEADAGFFSSFGCIECHDGSRILKST